MESISISLQAFLFVSLVLLTYGGSLRGSPVQDFLSVHCNTTQICVDGTNQTKICSEHHLICCPDVTANDAYQIHYVEYPNDYRCCPGSNGKIYEKRSQTCNEGKVVDNGVGGNNYCGHHMYNPQRHKCCRLNESVANVYPLENGGRCCNENLLTDPSDDCCEGLAYKKSLKTCCPVRDRGSLVTTYKLFDIPGGDCCTDEAFRPQSQICNSNGVVEDYDGDLPRCGSGRYNATTEICCNNKAAPKNEKVCAVDRKGSFFLVRKSHSTHDSACNVKRLGWVTYDSTNKQKVCTAVGLYHLNKDESMCGENKKYNKSADLCCGGHSPGYKHNGILKGLKCCLHGTKAYDPRTQICCPTDRLSNISESNGACCRNQGYDTSTHACVAGSTVVLWKSQSLLDVRKQLEKGGAYIYFGSALKQTKKGKKTHMWKMSDAKALTAKKKKLTKLSISSAGRRGNIRAEIPAMFPMKKNKRYLFILSKKKKSNKISAISSNDLILPLDDHHFIAIDNRPAPQQRRRQQNT